MKPFHIQCDSCLTQLKVTKESAIGKILACPKCGSMVQVTPPQETDSVEETIDSHPETSPEVTPAEPAAAGSHSEPQAKDLMPSAAWTSAETQARRKLLVLGTAVSVGVVIVLGAIGFIVTQLGKADREISQNETPSEAPPAETDQTTGVAQETVEASATDEATEPETEEGDPETVVDPSATPIEPSGSDVENTGDDENSALSDPEPQENEDPDAAPPEFETPSLEAGSTVSPFDTVLADLNALGSIMEESAFDKARAIAEQELRVAYRVRVTPNEVFAERPKPKKINFEAGMELPLASVNIEATTLEGLINFARGLSGLPIMVDPVALEATDTSMTAPLTVSTKETSLGNLLSGTLEPLGLGWYRDDNLVVISVQGADGLVTEELTLGRLADDFPPQSGILTQLIFAMVEPERWSAESGASLERNIDRLTIRQTPLVIYKIKQFLSEWQDKLENRSDAAPVSMSRRDLARKMLETEVSLEHLQPKLLQQLVQELSGQVEGTILVDWKRLNEQGWTIETELSCSLAALPLDLALDDLLRPAGLGFRVVHEDFIQITTIDAALGAPDIEFYDVSRLMTLGISSEELSAQLPQVFRAVGPQDPGKRFYFDAENQLLVAALPQPQQRALARFLNAWTQFEKTVSP